MPTFKETMMDVREVRGEVAKRLQWEYSKAVLGKRRTWAKTSRADRKIWTHLARVAIRKMAQLEKTI